MTEFSTSGLLNIEVSQASLRSARSTIESELGGVGVDVTASASASDQLAQDGGQRLAGNDRTMTGSLLSDQTERIGTVTNQLTENLDLNEIRNDLLRELIDETERAGRRAARSGGLGGGGALGLLALGGAGVAGLGATLMSQIEVPNINPTDLIGDTARVTVDALIESPLAVGAGSLIASAASILAGDVIDTPVSLSPSTVIEAAASINPVHLIATAATIGPAALIASQAGISPSDVIGAAASISPSDVIATAATVTPGSLIATAATVTSGAVIATAATITAGHLIEAPVSLSVSDIVDIPSPNIGADEAIAGGTAVAGGAGAAWLARQGSRIGPAAGGAASGVATPGIAAEMIPDEIGSELAPGDELAPSILQPEGRATRLGGVGEWLNKQLGTPADEERVARIRGTTDASGGGGRSNSGQTITADGLVSKLDQVISNLDGSGGNDITVDHTSTFEIGDLRELKQSQQDDIRELERQIDDIKRQITRGRR